MDPQQCVAVRLEDQLEEVICLSVEDTAVLPGPGSGFSEEKPPYWTPVLYNMDQEQQNQPVGVMDQNYSLVFTS
ncbi:hypothetical protein KUCAC02_022246 [Chaenocephalus aceratus]|nr:hypothetical protein KUCAC02_022246 [Chaenocephalus aceratus]